MQAGHVTQQEGRSTSFCSAPLQSSSDTAHCSRRQGGPWDTAQQWREARKGYKISQVFLNMRINKQCSCCFAFIQWLLEHFTESF